uniref:Keratin 99 n=1 Tax=Fundulus heteroclitus TaxID=8078 RepID=A0A3Q2NPT1_FUNHE
MGGTVIYILVEQQEHRTFISGLKPVICPTLRSIMPVRQQNFSSSATVGGWMRQRTSKGYLRCSAPSVHGGAGGYGTRISSSSVFGHSGSVATGGELTTGGKFTMQNLNDRLASYLEKVRPDLTSDENNWIFNSKLAADDFKNKYEMEMNMRKMVEADVLQLRGMRDCLTLAISSLEMTVEETKEDLICMSNSHKEVRVLRLQGAGKVNVEVDSNESIDLEKVLEEMRERYEAIMKKNKEGVEKWFQSKTETLQEQILTCTTEVQTYHSEISKLKRTYQALEISRQSLCTEQNISDVNSQYSVNLSQYQTVTTSLETELQALQASMAQLHIKYSSLLDLKTRLEAEIVEYRRLLEGENPVAAAEVITNPRPGISSCFCT